MARPSRDLQQQRRRKREEMCRNSMINRTSRNHCHRQRWQHLASRINGETTNEKKKRSAAVGTRKRNERQKGGRSARALYSFHYWARKCVELYSIGSGRAPELCVKRQIYALSQWRYASVFRTNDHARGTCSRGFCKFVLYSF